MSNHHQNEFLGFGATAPPSVVPGCLYGRIFFPPIKTNGGVPVEAPYGLRKAEAQLIIEGFQVLTVNPDHLHRYIDAAHVLGVYAMDPFGLGPASSTFAKILGAREACSARYFRILLEKPEVMRAKRRGLRIIVGGPGTWQFKCRPEFLDEHGIDCVVGGEARRLLANFLEGRLTARNCPDSTMSM